MSCVDTSQLMNWVRSMSRLRSSISGIDSLTLLAPLESMQEHYDVVISDEEVGRIWKVGDLQQVTTTAAEHAKRITR